jgi:hypothetical protein
VENPELYAVHPYRLFTKAKNFSAAAAVASAAAAAAAAAVAATAADGDGDGGASADDSAATSVTGGSSYATTGPTTTVDPYASLDPAITAMSQEKFKSDVGWNQNAMDAALLGLGKQAQEFVLARARTLPATGYRFPAFMPHEQV